jgi:ethanolamine ammonia-lyase small subunit
VSEELAAGTGSEKGRLREFTPARASLKRAGSAIATREQLEFQLDHALARDAVHALMDERAMLAGLRARRLEAIAMKSAAEEQSGRGGRETYLRRPDLGRRLHEDCPQALRERGAAQTAAPDVVFVIVDGLSAMAVERHALAVLDATLARLAITAWRVGPVCVVSQGRVAIGDEIGAALRARATVVLIGERPGLSSPDSLGVYVTWEPRPGRTDAERNCVSNVRLEGLGYADAAERIEFLLDGARRLQGSGVELRRAGETWRRL